jgi:hypothetical protein
MRFSLFKDVTEQWLIVIYRRFFDCLTLEDGTNWLSIKFSDNLSVITVSHPRRVKTTTADYFNKVKDFSLGLFWRQNVFMRTKVFFL